MKTIYICTDSVTGIFSAVYEAWKERAGRVPVGSPSGAVWSRSCSVSTGRFRKMRAGRRQ